ncbi:MAG TPA: GNAT family protein [Methylomirabilota bacterium]|nr:GNAT family protein [Methylomirabilota bacterium]
MEIVLSRCTLRRWRAGDEASLVRHANNRNVWRNLSRLPHPYTAADADAWICRASAQTTVTDFAIVVDGAAVGGIGVERGHDVFYRSAEIGYWLGEAYWGRGIATEALRAVTEYAFESFNLCRLEAGVFEWNGASMRVLEKAGYALEGRRRRAITKDGLTVDRLVYALVRDDA